MMLRRKLVGLDLLKVLAATLIVFHHYQQVFKVQFNGINFYKGFFDFGFFVELFFLISGFLTLYSNKAEEGIARPLVKKLLRFFPMATIACTFTLLVKSIKAADLATLWNVKSLMANYLLIFSGWPFFSMIGYNNPTWYLCVLIQCYLVFYLIECICAKTGMNRVYFDISVIIIAFALYRFHLLPNSTYRGLEAFSLGLTIYNLKDRIPKKKWLLISIMAISVILLLLIPSQQRRIVTFLCFPAIVLLCVWQNDCKESRVTRTIFELGRMSFEVYLWHYPLMAVIQMIIRVSGFELSHSYITMVLFTVFVWFFAYPICKYIETPINRTIRKRQS